VSNAVRPSHTHNVPTSLHIAETPKACGTEITILIPSASSSHRVVLPRRFTLPTSSLLSFTPPTHLNLLLLVSPSTLVPATAAPCSTLTLTTPHRSPHSFPITHLPLLPPPCPAYPSGISTRRSSSRKRRSVSLRTSRFAAVEAADRFGFPLTVIADSSSQASSTQTSTITWIVSVFPLCRAIRRAK
jgi:hypothetical protein